MKLIFFTILLFSCGCIAENSRLQEQLRVCEIQNQVLNRELDLSEARLREIMAEIHKDKK